MKEIIAYVGINNLDKITENHAKIFTRINMAFAVLRGSKLYIKNEDNMVYLKKLKSYNDKLKIVLSIGGAGAFGFSDMAMQPETRRIFIESMMKYIEKYDLNGIDLDWEFPTADWGGDHSPKDKENFTILLREMRESLDKYKKKKLILTIAAGVGKWFIDTTEVSIYKDYLDEFMLMTYDLSGFGQELAGHHTILYPKKFVKHNMSASEGVELLVEQGVPKEKIVIGAAMYSRIWRGVPNINGGLLQKSDPNGGNETMSYPDIQKNVIENDDYTVYWDDEAKVSWALSKDGVFQTFDDEKSVQEKCKYVLDNNLGGIMFWEYVDWPENKLIDAMKILK